MKKIILLVMAGAGITLLTQCAKNDMAEQITGAGTLVGNPSSVVAGSLYYTGGSPAKNVVVHIQKQHSLAQAPGSSLPNQSKDTATVMTDTRGVFSFENSLDSGMYAIEAQSGNSAVFIDSITVSRPSTPKILAPDTLRPAGAIKGVIRLPEGNDPQNVYVLAFGVNRFTRVKSDGSFVFFPLAQGTYDLRIISSLENYGTFDTNNIQVTPSDTTNIGFLELPFTGIPIPKNITLSYDTMKQIVTVRWNRVNKTNIKSFNIYRRNTSATSITGAMLNSSPITDTVYCDSTGVQDQTYAYSIASVDSFETVGTLSPEASIKLVSAFVKISGTTFQGAQFGEVDFTLDKQDNFWFADYQHHKVIKYAPSGDLISQWVPSGDSSDYFHPNIAVDASKNIYLSDFPGLIFQKYDSSGNLLNGIVDTTMLGIFGTAIDENGFIYCCFLKKTDNTQGYINKYNPDLTLNKSWKTHSNYLHHGIVAKNGKVYCTGIVDYSPAPPIERVFPDNVIEIFDSFGTALNTIHIRQGGEKGNISTSAIAMGTNGLLYCLDASSGAVRIFDETSGIVGKFILREQATDRDQVNALLSMSLTRDNMIVVRGWYNRLGNTQILFFGRR